MKNALHADRLSDRHSWDNAFRLLLHAAAYWLLDTLRRWLAAAQAEAAHLQLDTLRLRVLKVGGWVREVADRYGPDLCLHLSSHHPGARLWALLTRSTRVYAWGP